MTTSNILLRPSFWYAFVILVIVVLFIYGMRISQDSSNLTKAQKELEQRTEELTSCNDENELKSKKLSELNNILAGQQQTISEQSNSLSQNQGTIADLQTRLFDLENRPPRIEYRDKPEPYHTYGKGYGKLTIYSECSTCMGIHVTVDGEDWGVLNYYFSGQPNCGQDGTISKIVSVGKHHIKGKDKNNYTWDYYTTVKEDKCNFWHYGN